MTAVLNRTTFETSRTSEYFDAKELTLMTGQDMCRFAIVALKELVDNALDACETAGKSPEIEISVEYTDDDIVLTVKDNGSGFDSETIERILNFQTRTSDKAAYKSPTRGAQGNALKTIIGMPFALGGDHPVRIKTSGIEHIIHCWIDPAGELRTEHDKKQLPNDVLEGTQITVTLPMSEQDFGPAYWAAAFSVFNPHALVKFSKRNEQTDDTLQAQPEESKIVKFYHPTVTYPDNWKKFLPTDKTSPHWYNQPSLSKLIFSHIALSKKGGTDLTLRDFVRQFQGLTGTAKAKKICQTFPAINRLSDFENNQDSIPVLLESMKGEAKPVSFRALGTLGKEHFQTVFENMYGVKRYWYKVTNCLVNGVPYIFEVGLAETEKSGTRFFGVNFSPTFEDPLSDTRIPCAGLDTYAAYGIENFFNSARVFPEPEQDRFYAVAIHLICPALTFKDRGKTRVTIPSDVSVGIGKALWAVSKKINREAKQRGRDAAKAQREQERRERPPKTIESSLVEAVNYCLEDAYNSGTNNGQNDISVRDLYYEVRPLVQKYTSKTLEYNYFSQTILPKYRRESNKLERLYYKPRGILYEPHSGREVQLGTREVSSYDFPSWLYNKILYIEKSGVAQILRDSGLPDKYDMAVISAEGYASEAVRVLLKNADKQQRYQIFVWHDADPDGYNIARTISEETKRMPGYSVQVYDLGLFLPEAIEMGLQTETFTRKKAIPQSLRLDDLEKEYFIGEQKSKKSWACERIEINAMPVRQRPAYIERKLQELGAIGKVVPPQDDLTQLTSGIYSEIIHSMVGHEIERIFNHDKIKRIVAEKFRSEFNLAESRQWIDDAFDMDKSLSWDRAIESKIRSKYKTMSKDIQESIFDHIRKDNTDRLI